MFHLDAGVILQLRLVEVRRKRRPREEDVQRGFDTFDVGGVDAVELRQVAGQWGEVQLLVACDVAQVIINELVARRRVCGDEVDEVLVSMEDVVDLREDLKVEVAHVAHRDKRERNSTVDYLDGHLK